MTATMGRTGTSLPVRTSTRSRVSSGHQQLVDRRGDLAVANVGCVVRRRAVHRFSSFAASGTLRPQPRPVPRKFRSGLPVPPGLPSVPGDLRFSMPIRRGSGKSKHLALRQPVHRSIDEGAAQSPHGFDRLLNLRGVSFRPLR